MDILKFRVSEMAFPGVFSTMVAMLFRHNARKTQNIAVEMSQVFQDIAHFNVSQI